MTYKWIAGGIGWFMGGPIGALIGFGLGALYDSKKNDATTAAAASSRRVTPRTRNDFMVSLIVLVAAVIKADGKIMQSELNFVKRFLTQQFGEEQAKEAFAMLSDVLKQPVPVYDVCEQIRQNMSIASRRELLHLLFGVAAADGDVAASEVQLIGQIATHLGLSNAEFESVKAMFVIKNHDWAYKILEISRTASDDEIKKAYRSMAQKHHPDKVAQMGKDVQQAATEKFKKIKEAYDYIKKERNIN
jgi:DnaJ like chaperone protein